MREYKFRAWYPDQKIMSEPHELTEVDWQSIVSNVVYLQFTGLHDKNGKEIYEGYILQGNTYRANEPIEYNTVHGFYPAIFHRTINNDVLEIIGNIYENPELLESGT